MPKQKIFSSPKTKTGIVVASLITLVVVAIIGATQGNLFQGYFNYSSAFKPAALPLPQTITSKIDTGTLVQNLSTRVSNLEAQNRELTNKLDSLSRKWANMAVYLCIAYHNAALDTGGAQGDPLYDHNTCMAKLTPPF